MIAASVARADDSETKNTATVKPVDCSNEYQKYGFETAGACADHYISLSKTSTADDCQNAKKQAGDAFTAMTDSWVSATGDMIQDAITCSCFQKKNVPPYCPEASAEDPNLADYEKQVRADRKSGVAKEIRDKKGLYRACPDVAAGDRDGLKSKLDDSKKEVERLQRAVNEKTDEANQLQAKLKNAQEQYNQDVDNADKELQAATSKLESDQQKSLSEIQTKIKVNGLNRQKALGDEMGELEAADLMCETRARELLGEELKKRFEQLQSSSLSPGNQQSLFDTVGKTRQQKNSDIAMEHYIACKRSGQYLNMVAVAKRKYELAMSAAEAEIGDLQTQLSSIVSSMPKAIQSLKDQTESRKKSAAAKLSAIQNEVVPRIYAITGKSMNGNQIANQLKIFGSMKPGQKDVTGLGADDELGQLKTQLAAEQENQAEYIALYAEAKKAGPSSDKGGKFMNNFSKYQREISNQFNYCCVKDDTYNAASGCDAVLKAMIRLHIDGVSGVSSDGKTITHDEVK